MDRGYRAVLSLSAGVLCCLVPGLAALRAQQEPRPSVEATPAPTVAAPAPREKEPTVLPAHRSTVLNIDRDGRLTLNQEPTVLSQEEMGMRLQRLHQEQGESFAVVIRSAKDLPYSNVTGVLDKLRSIGIVNVSFASVGAKPAEAAAGPKPPPPGPSAPETPRERIKTALMSTRQHEETGPAMAAARVAQMTPGERKSFEENLRVWRQMPMDERLNLRKQANERNREEIAKALKDSGLQLDNDQQEIFALRYLQERRKLEREIQEQANTERTRRLPQVLQTLKHEFAASKSAPVSTPPGASPTVSVSAPPKPAPPTPTPTGN